MNQNKKGDVEFIIAGDDNVTQVLKEIVEQLQNVKQQANQTGRQIDSSLDKSADSSRRTGEAVKTVGDRLRELGDGVTHIKKITTELERTEDSAKGASREMQRGFQESGRAADQAATRITHLKQRITEVASSMRGLMDSINDGTAGFQSFVGDQVRRGAYVGALAVTGFTAQSVKKNVDVNYEFAQLGSTLKSGYYKDGKFDEKAFNQDFSKLKDDIKAQGLRPDREPGTIDVIAIAKEMAKNNMNAQAISAALPVLSDFAQANGGKGGITPDEAAKYLANKLEAAKLAYTPENFQKVADQFTKTVDMSSLDPRDLLYAEKYTDFGNAIGGVDYAISQAMQVLLSKVSVEGETAGTSLRTLFIESSKLGISDNARSNVSSEKVGRVIDAIIKDVNSVNGVVDADKSIAQDQKGNEKILRKAAIMNKYMSQLTNDQQIEVGSLLFGKEAANVTTIFAGDGYKNLLETIDAIKGSTGITKRYADDRANTDKGGIIGLGKAVDKIQMEVGDSLQPLLEATTKQLTDLATEGKFSFDEINKGVEQSADLLARNLNPEIAEVFEKLSHLATNGFQIGVSLTPLAEGMGKSLINLLNGDVAGAAKEIVLAINATDLKIENLPGELQGLATAAKNAALFLAAMVAVDKGIKLAENGKKIWDAGQKVGETIRGAGKSNGPAVGELEQTIRANVVNVYGATVNGKGSSGGGGSTPVPIPPTQSKGDEPSPQKKPKYGKVAKGFGLTSLALLGLDMAGFTDELPDYVQSAIDYFQTAQLANWIMGNPAGALAEKLPAGASGAVGVTGAIGLGWLGALKVYGDSVNKSQADQFHQKYDPVGADLWFEAQSGMKLQPSSTPKDRISARYGADVGGMIDYLVKNRDSNSSIFLKGFSKELLDEAIQNAKNDTPRMFRGIGDTNIEEYLDNRFRAYVAKYKKPKEEVQYERLRKADGENLYKEKMTNLILSQPVKTATETLFPQFSSVLSALSEAIKQPIRIDQNNSIRIIDATQSGVKAFFEDPSVYAQKTQDRTLTPMQTVKRRQLE